MKTPTASSQSAEMLLNWAIDKSIAAIDGLIYQIKDYGETSKGRAKPSR